MPASREGMSTGLRSIVMRLAATALLAVTVPATPSFAQAAGQVRASYDEAERFVRDRPGESLLL